MGPYELKGKVLEIQNVSLSLGGRKILRDISYTIQDVVRPDCVTGQVIAILGPSGIGKTKLFEIIAGLRPPDTGQVLLNDTSTPVRRGQVGVVFQNYPLFEHRTVLGNLITAGMLKPAPGTHKRLSKKEVTEKALEILEQFGLRTHAKFYPAQLSGGQRQRVAIAQQLMCSEHFMLMDEPFSGLDPNMIEEVCRIIQTATNRHELNTTIVVTHDVTAAVSIADIILLMGWQRDENGNWIEGATMIEIYDLMADNLAWRPGIATTVECAELVRKIKGRFKEIKR
jgi:ABC-type polar amino acid transport system ATPase subunit